MVGVALNNVQSYFSKNVVVSDDRQVFLNYFKSAGYQYFKDRDYFLNVYLLISDNGDYLSGTLAFQLCNGFNGFLDADLSIRNNRSVIYDLVSDVSFYGYAPLDTSSGVLERDGVFIPNNRNFIFQDSTGNSNILKSSFTLNGSFSSYLEDSFINHNYFITYYGDNLFRIRSSIISKYILPLYIDSPIYFPLSFLSNYNDIEVYGDFNFNSSGSLLFYTPNNIDLNIDTFNVNKWVAGEFNSGIVYGSIFINPFLTPTPYPTFNPIYTTTPFPTYFINSTLTPIAIPNDPTISSGYGDPISTIWAIFDNLFQVLSLGYSTFVATVIQYVYNSSVFFQILMFLVPGIVLISFAIGRLKRK